VDLFDTLVMRRTLFPSDVFDLVDFRLKQRGILIHDFPSKRLEAEKDSPWLIQETRERQLGKTEE